MLCIAFIHLREEIPEHVREIRKLGACLEDESLWMLGRKIKVDQSMYAREARNTDWQF